jgi:hypothetical protein
VSPQAIKQPVKTQNREHVKAHTGRTHSESDESVVSSVDEEGPQEVSTKGRKKENKESVTTTQLESKHGELAQHFYKTFRDTGVLTSQKDMQSYARKNNLGVISEVHLRRLRQWWVYIYTRRTSSRKGIMSFYPKYGTIHVGKERM